MDDKMNLECPLSPEIAVEMDRVKKRRSSLGPNRLSTGINRRVSLAQVPPIAVQDQVSDIDENLPWNNKLNSLLDIALRETVRRLETRLQYDENISELRAIILTSSNTMAEQLSQQIGDLTPTAATTATATAATAAATTATAAAHVLSNNNSVEIYKENTKELQQEYKTWKLLRRQREEECCAAEKEFEETKCGETSLDESHEMHLSQCHRNLIHTWTDPSHYLQEAQNAMEEAHLASEEIRQTSALVNGFLTASRFKADSIYMALESINNGHIKKRPLTAVMNELMQLNFIAADGEQETPSTKH